MARLRAALTLAAVLLGGTVSAHDIPASVVVQAFVRPQGDTLRLLVRVPLGAMRDVELPLREDGGLDVSRAEPAIRNAAMLWLGRDIAIWENDRQLAAPRLAAARVSLPSDRAFATFDTALASTTGPALTSDTNIIPAQAMLDALFEYSISSDRARFSIRPTLARLGLNVTTVLRYQPPGSAERAFEYHGDPGLVRLDPRWHQAAWRFVQLGFAHILDGTDHLLFLFCLVIPFRQFRALVLIVTAFTVAHSITLIAAASGLAPDSLWFAPLVETLIAASILYMALENIAGTTNVQRRWGIAFAFGLVHGFGFSFALRETLQFAGAHLLTSLLAFNVGVELGQLAVLAVLVPALQLAFRFVVAERIGTIILSALVAHTGWHWTTDRWDRLREFGWPTIAWPATADALRWLMLAVLAAAIAWLIDLVTRRKRPTAAVNYPPNSGRTTDDGPEPV